MKWVFRLIIKVTYSCFLLFYDWGICPDQMNILRLTLRSHKWPKSSITFFDKNPISSFIYIIIILFIVFYIKYGIDRLDVHYKNHYCKKEKLVGAIERQLSLTYTKGSIFSFFLGGILIASDIGILAALLNILFLFSDA